MTCPRTHIFQVAVFGLQQSFYLFQSNIASQNHRVSCQTLQTSPFGVSILRKTIFPQLTVYGITLLSVQRAKPQAEPCYWVIHFDKEAGKADGPRGFCVIQQLHLFSFEPIRACHFKMKSSKNPEPKPLILKNTLNR